MASSAAIQLDPVSLVVRASGPVFLLVWSLVAAAGLVWFIFARTPAQRDEGHALGEHERHEEVVGPSSHTMTSELTGTWATPP